MHRGTAPRQGGGPLVGPAVLKGGFPLADNGSNRLRASAVQEP
jgi:hypothetical protein